MLSNCYHCSRQQLGLKSQPPIKSVSCTMTWPSVKNAMDAMLYLVLSRYWHHTFFQTYSATSPLNPHWEMDKTFWPSYSPSQITYVEAEAVGFSRFRFRIPDFNPHALRKHKQFTTVKPTWQTIACIMASKPPSGLSRLDEYVTFLTLLTKAVISEVRGRSLWKL